MRVALATCLIVLAAGGCKRPAPVSGPDGAYRAWATSVRAGDARGAYAGLSAKTRAAMEARTRAVADASFGLVKDDAALAMFQSGVRPGPVGEVKVVESSGDSAVLEVTSEGTTHTVRMVKDDGTWAVDLTQMLEATP